MMLFAAGTYSEIGVASPCSRQLGELLLGRWARGRAVCMDGDKAVKRNLEREGAMVLNALSRDMLDDAQRLLVALQEGKRTGLSPALPWSLPNTCTLLNYARALRYEISLRKNLSFEGGNLYLCAIDGVSTADVAMQNDGVSYDIVAANPLLASQKSYCCLGAQNARRMVLDPGILRRPCRFPAGDFGPMLDYCDFATVARAQREDRIATMEWWSVHEKGLGWSGAALRRSSSCLPVW